MKLEILKNLKKPIYLFTMLGTTFLFFDINYYMMANLPGTRDYMCVIGAYLTLWNISFSVVLSLLTGLMVAAFVALFREKRGGLAASSTVSGIGLLLGSFTVFCTFCSIPVISLFGLSLGLSFFTTYNLAFKIISMALMLGGVYLINKQLANECVVCKQ